MIPCGLMGVQCATCDRRLAWKRVANIVSVVPCRCVEQDTTEKVEALARQVNDLKAQLATANDHNAGPCECEIYQTCEQCRPKGNE